MSSRPDPETDCKNQEAAIRSRRSETGEGDVVSEPKERQQFREALGARLGAARLAGGMSYGDVEAATGISRGDVRKYEVGHTEPGAWKLRLMARALNTTRDGLAGL